MHYALARRVAKNYRVGLKTAGDAVGRDLVDAGMQIEIEKGAGDGKVLVVNGERNRGCGCCAEVLKAGMRTATTREVIRTIFLLKLALERPGRKNLQPAC